MKLDLDTLTINETRILCKKVGVRIDQLDDADPLDLMQAFVWVVGKRTNPSLTYEEAGEMNMLDLDVEDDKATPSPRSPRKDRKS